MKERIHSRNVTIETYDIGDDRLLVEGSLLDERHNVPPMVAGAESIHPEIIHGMTVRMTLSLPQLKIVALEAEMPVIPHPECAEIRAAVEGLQGIEIKHGFTESVQRRLGKTQGCLHMMNLVLAMGSAAVQGMWCHFAGKRPLGQSAKSTGHDDMLLDSCWVWRKGGPLAGRLKNKG